MNKRYALYCFLFIFVLLLFGLAGCGSKSRIKIVSNGMEPTLKVNSVYQAEQVKAEDVTHGDIIVFKRQDGASMVKRVIGLPGDTVQIRDNSVYVNNNGLVEDYVQNNKIADYGPVTLDQDQYFVLGDNRMMSDDSRIFGPINGSEIYERILLK